MFPTMTAPCIHRWKQCPAVLRFPAETGGWSMPPTWWWPVCSTIGAEPRQPCDTPDKKEKGLFPIKIPNRHGPPLKSLENKTGSYHHLEDNCPFAFHYTQYALREIRFK